MRNIYNAFQAFKATLWLTHKYCFPQISGFSISITQKNELDDICICLNYMKILLQVDMATVLLPQFRGAQLLLPVF